MFPLCRLGLLLPGKRLRRARSKRKKSSIRLADQFEIGRDLQDQFALESQLKAARAQQEGRFKQEITLVILTNKGKQITIAEDEYIRHDAKLERPEDLKSAFKMDWLPCVSAEVKGFL
ncbi:hypothetical protein AB432_015670 [Brevibacillus brevis]|uniref:Thiolase N-terminal domain-containing protein n=1 Tax=Brevibacillus brevis TaxID=1393 RepID=A0A2Z4MIN2_BREBE|nr:hypothetical protein AB432_015670 [Brevibacillus brevis]